MHKEPTVGHFEEKATTYRIKKMILLALEEKREKPRANKLELSNLGQLFKHISIDFVGPLPLTKQGNKYLIVATKYLTKWPKARVIPNCTAKTATLFLYNDIICPYELITDHGSYFDNVEKYNQTLCKNNSKIKKVTTPAKLFMLSYSSEPTKADQVPQLLINRILEIIDKLQEV
ncbi:11033_t:CDS:2, partial [Gigaspora margarita]